MIDCNYIKKFMEENCYSICFVFDYKGEPCGIDPVSGEFNVWYGDNELRAKTWDEVENTKFFDGKTLREIVGDIENYETLAGD